MGDHRLVGEGAGKWGLGALLVWFATFAGAAHSAKEGRIRQTISLD